MKRLLLVIGALLLVPAVHAGRLQGTVTHVSDGDSLWVRPARGGEPVEVRLLNIDAPEGCQAHGRESRAALRARVLHQTVVVRTSGRDRYKRTLGKLELRGDDINAWLVRGGHAWATGAFRSRGPYAALEGDARRARRGLWAKHEALEPWRFRKQHGRCEH
jgi:micrococcal nuclease